jgi:hypothetical protein
VVVGIGISSPLKYLLDKEEAPAFHIRVKSYVKKIKTFWKIICDIFCLKMVLLGIIWEHKGT